MAKTVHMGRGTAKRASPYKKKPLGMPIPDIPPIPKIKPQGKEFEGPPEELTDSSEVGEAKVTIPELRQLMGESIKAGRKGSLGSSRRRSTKQGFRPIT